MLRFDHTPEELEELRKKHGPHSDEYLTACFGENYVRAMREPVPTENTYCKRCGGAMPASLILGNPRMCGCDVMFKKSRRAIAAIDPAEEMTFGALDSPHPTVKDTAAKLRDIVSGERDGGVFMFGLPGRGKTFLSMATARALLDQGTLAGVYNLAGLVGRIQDTYGYDDAAESRTKIVREVCSNDVVILDDIGKEHQSANVESIVYELIDGMYNARVTLIASSNLPGKDFVARYDGAVLSRLGGMCEKVVIRGEDRRAAKWEW